MRQILNHFNVEIQGKHHVILLAVIHTFKSLIWSLQRQLRICCWRQIWVTEICCAGKCQGLFLPYIFFCLFESHSFDAKQNELGLQNLQENCFGLNQWLNWCNFLFRKISNGQFFWEEVTRGKIYYLLQAVLCLAYALKHKHLHAVYVLICFMKKLLILI